MAGIIWVLASTASNKEAEKIGRAVLGKRLAACFGIYPRIKSAYFWPPQSNRLEESGGPLLVLETFAKNYDKIIKLIKSLHSGKVPFIGQVEIKQAEKNFFKWMKGEIN